MYTCTNTYIYIRIYTYICSYMYIYMYIYIRTYRYTYLHIYVYMLYSFFAKEMRYFREASPCCHHVEWVGSICIRVCYTCAFTYWFVYILVCIHMYIYILYSLLKKRCDILGKLLLVATP